MLNATPRMALSTVTNVTSGCCRAVLDVPMQYSNSLYTPLIIEKWLVVSTRRRSKSSMFAFGNSCLGHATFCRVYGGGYCNKSLVASHRARARCDAQARRARSGWRSGSMFRVARATMRQSAPLASAISRTA